MWETASEDLRGFGGHFELQPADEHGEGRSGASVQYPQDILVAELQGLHYVQPANSPIYLQGFESQSDGREQQQSDSFRSRSHCGPAASATCLECHGSNAMSMLRNI